MALTTYECVCICTMVPQWRQRPLVSVQGSCNDLNTALASSIMRHLYNLYRPLLTHYRTVQAISQMTNGLGRD